MGWTVYPGWYRRVYTGWSIPWYIPGEAYREVYTPTTLPRRHIGRYTPYVHPWYIHPMYTLGYTPLPHPGYTTMVHLIHPGYTTVVHTSDRHNEARTTPPDRHNEARTILTLWEKPGITRRVLSSLFGRIRRKERIREVLLVLSGVLHFILRNIRVFPAQLLPKPHYN